MNHVIIVAGGRGLRMGGEIPKQFIVLKGRPVLMRTMDAFYGFDHELKMWVVLPADQRKYWGELCEAYTFNMPHQVVDGGSTRFESVKHALDRITDHEEGYIAVHDGVRPFVGRDVIRRCFEAAAQYGSAVPVLDVVESLRRYDVETGKSHAVNRSEFCRVQTPQVFAVPLLKRAYAQPFSSVFTDDASVVETLGEEIHLVRGSQENIKLTTPIDIRMAEILLDE